MEVKIFKDYQSLSAQIAKEIIDCVRKKPAAILCLAAGDTPRLPYQLTTQRAAVEKLDFSQCHFIGLDEWVGIPPENEGSCQFFLRKYLFDPLSISPEQIHLFNAMSGNLERDCKAMDSIISGKGGIDLMIVGVGMNGHIGFNEPGVSFEKNAHVIDLDNSTQTVGQKYFKNPVVIRQGITLGFNQLQQSKNLILIANGLKKSTIIQKALEGEVSAHVPASILQVHPHSSVMIDEEAASLLSKRQT
jgi:glucosamine-6-phosphate isomerase